MLKKTICLVSALIFCGMLTGCFDGTSHSHAGLVTKNDLTEYLNGGAKGNLPHGGEAFDVYKITTSFGEFTSIYTYERTQTVDELTEEDIRSRELVGGASLPLIDNADTHKQAGGNRNKSKYLGIDDTLYYWYNYTFNPDPTVSPYLYFNYTYRFIEEYVARVQFLADNIFLVSYFVFNTSDHTVTEYIDLIVDTNFKIEYFMD